MTRFSLVCRLALAALVATTVSGCRDAVDALTAHSRPVATVAGRSLDVQELGQMLAESQVPDSALTGFWAASVARLWADYVQLVRLYQEPDSTESLDFDPLLEAGRYFAVVQVARYRDSVVLAGIEPTDDETREYYERKQPLTRLDVRRLTLNVPAEASEEVRDSLFAQAIQVRERVAGGADFVEMARRFSDEPAAARGQILAYQGHEDFAAIADSVVFALRPGEISPVFATGDQMVFYRIERRRAPALADVMDIVKNEMIGERRFARLTATSDSLLEGSFRIVADGAERIARTVASTAGMAAGRIPGSMRLVRYEGGEFTVSELRDLFRARPDLQRRFVLEEDDENDAAIALFLYELAGDEVLMQAATASGVDLPPKARAELRRGIGRQLAAIATRMRVSHAAAASPRFDVRTESRRFLSTVLAQAKPVPWLTEFRIVLDPVYPSRVDERSAEIAARIALERRASVAPSLGSESVDSETSAAREAEE
jgi:PPIC-type PPIASE domain